MVITDVCMCELRTMHCGILKGKEVDNDATLPISKIALSHVEAGADRRGAQRHDGRGRGVVAGGPAQDDDPLVRGEIRQRVLRSVPPGGGVRASVGDRQAYQMSVANAEEAIGDRP